MIYSCRRLLMLGIATVALAVSTAQPAYAQDKKEVWRDPSVQWAKDTTPYVPWLIAALFTAGVAAVSFKHPRRGAND